MRCPECGGRCGNTPGGFLESGGGLAPPFPDPPLSVMLLCGVGLSQIVVWIFYVTQYKFAADHALGIAGLLVGLAVTWYAVNLPANALGGALVLGWSAVMALWLLADMISWTASGVLGCLLLAAVIGLALIYMRPNAVAPEPLAL